MTLRGSAVLGLMAIALIAGLAWWLVGGRAGSDPGADAGLARLDREARPEASAPLSLPTSIEAATASSLQPEAGADPATAPTEAAADKAVLLLTLLRAEDDVPIAGVRVHAWVWTDVARHEGLNTLAPRTAADGTARLEFASAVQLHKLEAPPGPDHGYVEEESSLAIALGEVQHLVVHSRVGATVRGRVVDEQLVPVPGAGVLAWAEHHININSGDGPLPKPDLSSRCDAIGRFELRGVGRELALMPEVEGLAAVGGAMVALDDARDFGGEAEVVDGAVIEDVTLVVGAGVVLRGRVVDPDGRPVPEVWVQAGYMSYSSMSSRVASMRPLKSGGYTDASGAFAIGPIAPKTWWVSVTDDRYRPWGELITPGDTELLIALEAGCALSGMVYGADGAPLDGAIVTLQGASEARDVEAGGSAWAKTEAGRFAFGSLVPTKTAGLGVSAVGHAIHVVEPLVIAETPSAPLEVRLEPERLIAGRVVDEHDQPVAGAIVSVRGDRHLPDWPWTDRSWEEWIWPSPAAARSDDDGRFRLERLYDGAFALTVEDPRHEGLEHKLDLRSGVDDLLIRLNAAQLRRAVLSGTVRDAESGQPVDDFQIVMAPELEDPRSGMPVPFHDFRDAAGAYEVQGLEPGHWTLVASAEGHARTFVRGLELHDGEQQLDVSLLPARSLHLRVVDQERAPVTNIYVSFEDARGERIELAEQPAGVGTLGMTDASGELIAKGLPADRISVVLKVPLVPRAAVGTQRLRLPVDLRVQPEGVQELTIERTHTRCLVLSLNLAEAAAAPPGFIFDTDDAAALKTLMPLIESEALKPIEAPVVVTITAADGSLVDTARCAPNAQLADAWRVSSAVCDSEGEPTSWLAAALPGSESTVLISAEGYVPVTIALPAGEGHLKRFVILRPAQ